MLAAEVDIVIVLIEIVLQRGIGRQLETHADRGAETLRPADVILQVERPLVGLHLRDEHRVCVIIPVGDTKDTCRTTEDGSPVAGTHLVRCRLEGIIARSSLRIAVSSEVMLILDASKEVMLTQRHIHLVGDDRILGLCEVAVSEDVTHHCP